MAQPSNPSLLRLAYMVQFYIWFNSTHWLPTSTHTLCDVCLRACTLSKCNVLKIGYVFLCTCLPMYTWWPDVNIGCLYYILPLLIFCDCHWTWSPPFQLDCLTSKAPVSAYLLSSPCPEVTYTTTVPCLHMGCWRLKLVFTCLPSKRFAHWTISLAPRVSCLWGCLTLRMWRLWESCILHKSKSPANYEYSLYDLFELREKKIVSLLLLKLPSLRHSNIATENRLRQWIKLITLGRSISSPS